MSGHWLTPAFRRLCYTIVMSQAGFWLAVTMLQWHVANLTDGDPLEASRLYFCQLAPLFVLPPIAGALLDRLDRWSLIAWPTAIAAIIAVAVAAIDHLQEPGLGIHEAQVAAAAFGTMIAISTPTFQAMVPNVVPPEGLDAAVSVAAATLNVARLAGPGVAAVLLSGGAGIGVAMIVLCAIYVVGTLLMRGVPRHPADRETPTTYLQDVAGGFSEVLTRPDLRRAIALVAATAGFGLAYLSILPAVAIRVLRANEGAYSVLLMVAAVGAIVGALCGPLKPRTLSAASYHLVPMAIGAIVITRSTFLPLSIVACLMLSTFGTAVMIGLTVLVQRSTRDEVRGRVMSVFVWAWGGVLPIGGYLYGVLSDRWSLSTAGVIMAGTILVVAVANFMTEPRPLTPA